MTFCTDWRDGPYTYMLRPGQDRRILEPSCEWMVERMTPFVVAEAMRDLERWDVPMKGVWLSPLARLQLEPMPDRECGEDGGEHGRSREGRGVPLIRA